MSAGQADVLIVGAGLAGLACAIELNRRGLSSRLFEASDRVGGRVATDVVDGFLVDRGFQVLLDSYPEVRRLGLDRRLSLRAHEPGALIAQGGGRFQRVSDPWRRPLRGLLAALTGPGTWAEGWALAQWRHAALGHRSSAQELDETTSEERLRSLGLGDDWIESFFRPFFGGVFLDLELGTSSRMLEHLFPLFATGSATLPRGGMAALPHELATRLPGGSIRLHARVSGVLPRELTLDSGERLRGRAVVIATDASTAAGWLSPEAPEPTWRSACSLSFAAERDPVGEPTLVLDGRGEGPVTNLTVPSTVNPDYAPAGASLITAAVVGDPAVTDEELEEASRRQVRGWFGSDVDSWRLLRVVRTPRALPARPPGSLSPWRRPVERTDGIFACGDWLDNASIDGALASGRRAAEAVSARLGVEAR